jgi:hypothetical protein
MSQVVEMRQAAGELQSSGETMNDQPKGFLGFWRGVFSESDGSPSSSRVAMMWRCLADIAVVILYVIAITHASVDRLALLLSAFPVILAALSLWTVAPYGANKGAGAVSDAAQTLQSYFASKKQQ